MILYMPPDERQLLRSNSLASPASLASLASLACFLLDFYIEKE